jgi:hypothetical protein
MYVPHPLAKRRRGRKTGLKALIRMGFVVEGAEAGR